jgi:hypothetical protein
MKALRAEVVDLGDAHCSMALMNGTTNETGE